MKGLIGKKVGMTQLFDDAGRAVPVTVIKAGPCYVTQVRTVDQDGYSAVQLGFEETKTQRLSGGELGHLKKNELPPLRILREFRTNEDLEEGQTLTVEVFEEGERVDIVGRSKGRGFTGVVKRYGFSGGPKTHGQSDRHRAPGSIGAGSTPGRVFKGKRMPGRMGTDTVTSQNLLISRIDPENNIIAVRGSVPGPKNGLVIIKEARKQ
ncbi:MAG: 50S ribosomal protein L3 [Anaerolineales bacterium]|nr:50S ribosomal protein L3 [Anaerolineales bacterium]